MSSASAPNHDTKEGINAFPTSSTRRPSAHHNLSRNLTGSTYQDLYQTYPIPYVVHRQHGPSKSPGNPTALALFTFAITLGTVGVYYAEPAGLKIYNTVVGLTFFGGGITLWACAMLELWLGNTYGSVVLGGFSVFYLAFSATKIPWFGIVDAYAGASRQSNISNGIWIAAYSIFDMIVWAPTWRISRVFNFIIGILIPCFWCLSISCFVTNPTQALHWQKAGGYFAIAAAVAGFYAGAATIWTVETVGFNLPVGEYVAKKMASQGSSYPDTDGQERSETSQFEGGAETRVGRDLEAQCSTIVEK